MRLIRRASVGHTVFALLVFAAAMHGQQPVNRNLALMTPGAEISLRLKDEQVIAGVQLVSIDEKALAYKKDGMTVKIERDLVFRAKQTEIFYSDLPLSAEDHARYADYVSYIRERGDVIVDVDHQTYVGTIVTETDSAMTIRTRAASYDVEKRKIAAWRKGGVWQGDPEARQQPSSSIFSLDPYTDKNRFFNFAFLLTGPWAILPQIGIGIGSNVNWPVFGGVRGSVGYIKLDMNSTGMLAQLSGYLNINLINFGAGRIFAGTSYLWRAGMQIDTGKGSGFYSTYNSVYAVTSQNIYTLHLGLKYKNLMLEAGAEMPISYVETYTRPLALNTADQAEIEKAVSRVKGSLDSLNQVSRVYVLISLMF